MNRIATTKMSSKGQIVIPEDIRRRLQLEIGAQFVVVAEKDVIILKSIQHPDISEYSELIAKTRKHAKNVGITKQAVADAINEVRKKK